MKLILPEDVNERSRLVGWTVAVAALLVLGGLMIDFGILIWPTLAV